MLRSETKFPYNVKPGLVQVHGSGSVGCVAPGPDVMVTLGNPQPYAGADMPIGGPEELRFLAVFLTRDLAEALLRELSEALGPGGPRVTSVAGEFSPEQREMLARVRAAGDVGLQLTSAPLSRERLREVEILNSLGGLIYYDDASCWHLREVGE